MRGYHEYISNTQMCRRCQVISRWTIRWGLQYEQNKVWQIEANILKQQQQPHIILSISIARFVLGRMKLGTCTLSRGHHLYARSHPNICHTECTFPLCALARFHDFHLITNTDDPVLKQWQNLHAQESALRLRWDCLPSPHQRLVRFVLVLDSRIRVNIG
jgi:hypothetical protein